MGSLFLGIDLGTSAVKVVVVDETAREVSAGSAACKVHEPDPGRQEQDLDEVWESTVRATRRALAGVDASAVRSVSFSGAMHGMMAVDKEGKPLTRMFTWADGRSASQSQNLARRHDGSAIFTRTGCPVTALYYPARILWLQENEPALFQDAARFVSIQDAIVYRLIGKWVTGRSHQSSNGLLDVRRLEWDETTLSLVGIGPERLPELVHPDEPAGTMTPGTAAELGLPPGVMVVPGAGDGGLANLGSGAIEPGQAAVTVGTSAAVRKVLSSPWLDPAERVWCYYLAAGRWYAGGAVNSGGIVLRWLADQILSDVRDQAIAENAEPYERIIALAVTVGPGAEGLMFLPYIHGERTPYWNPKARGVMFGLAPHHGKAHLARAALEGICMSVTHVYELLQNSPGGVSEVRASGGFTRSPAWVQIMADMLGAPIALPRARENSALGAAILGMKAAGIIKDLSEAGKLIKIERIFEPDLKKTAFYRQRFEMFKRLYCDLERDFEKWSGLQGARDERK